MSRPRPRRPSPAMVVAFVALSLALGGTAYAATSGLISSGSTPALARCRADVYGAFRFKSSGTMAQRAAATQAICGESSTGVPGPQGLKGETGAMGPRGETGAAGPSSYAEFYALMPGDNVAPVAAGSAVEFPQNGPQAGDIVRSGPRTFVLPDIGTYRVSSAVSVDEPGQLELTVNGVELPYTVNGRATGTSQITGEALVTTVSPNSTVSLINPAGNSPALTITPVAGGTHAVAASLIVEQLG